MERVGFVGVGAMGGAMAARMIERGVRLMVTDPNPKAAARMAALGAEIAESPRALADAVEVIFASLPNAAVSREVALGEVGIGRGHRVKTYVETSTLGSEAISDIAAGLGAVGVEVLDAPISGAVPGARMGSLSIMIAGPNAALARIKALLPLFTAKSFYLGAWHGAAQTCKLVNNAIACTAMLASCEAIAAGVSAGLDEAMLLEVINASSGANLFTREMYPAFIASRKFAGAGPIENGGKDLALFVREAARLDAPADLAEAAAQLWGEAAASGAPGRDASLLLAYFQSRARLPDLKN